MAASREELREQLMAVIEAAPELSKEDRGHLTDVFLDQLNAQYSVVPRGAGKNPRARASGGGRRDRRRPPWVPILVVLAIVFFVVPAVLHHLPFLLFAGLIVFFLARNGHLGGRRRVLWR